MYFIDQLPWPYTNILIFHRTLVDGLSSIDVAVIFAIGLRLAK